MVSVVGAKVSVIWWLALTVMVRCSFWTLKVVPAGMVAGRVMVPVMVVVLPMGLWALPSAWARSQSLPLSSLPRALRGMPFWPVAVMPATVGLLIWRALAVTVWLTWVMRVYWVSQRWSPKTLYSRVKVAPG